MEKIFILIALFFSANIYAQTVSTFYQSSSIDDGLAFDSEGNLYGSQYTGSSVWRITPDGVWSKFVTGLDTPNGLAFDSNGDLHVVDNQGGKIIKVTPDSVVTTLVPNVFSPSGIIKMPTSDTMIVSSWEGDKLMKVAPDGTYQDYIVGNGLEGPVGMAFDENHNLFVGNYNDRWIFKISPEGVMDTLTRLTVPGDNIGFIAYRQGFIYATLAWDHKIYKVDMDGNFELFAGQNAGSVDGDVSEAKFNGPNGILLSPGGDSLYISDFNTRSIRIISDLDGPNSTDDYFFTSNITEIKLVPNLTSVNTQLEFTLSDSEELSISLFDTSGQQLKSLIQNQRFDIGTYNIPVSLDGLVRGTYFVRINTKGGAMIVKKLVKID